MEESIDKNITVIDVTGHGVDQSNIATTTGDLPESNGDETSIVGSSTNIILSSNRAQLEKNPVWEYCEHFDLAYHLEKVIIGAVWFVKNVE